MGSTKGLQPLRAVSRSLNAALPAAYAGAQVASRRYAGTLANFKVPTVNNEPNVSWRGYRCSGDALADEGFVATLHQRLCGQTEASRRGRSVEEAGSSSGPYRCWW